jgi:hypothetical protein
VNIQSHLLAGGISWVIQGGESGTGRRPFDLEWAKYMMHQCRLAEVPYFFKQIDKVQEIPAELQVRMFPGDKWPRDTVALTTREEQLAKEWIAELTAAGYTPDDMMAVFKEARRKYDDFKKRKTIAK